MTNDPIVDAKAASARGDFESAVSGLRPLAEAGSGIKYTIYTALFPARQLPPITLSRRWFKDCFHRRSVLAFRLFSPVNRSGCLPFPTILVLFHLTIHEYHQSFLPIRFILVFQVAFHYKIGAYPSFYKTHHLDGFTDLVPADVEFRFDLLEKSFQFFI